MGTIPVEWMEQSYEIYDEAKYLQWEKGVKKLSDKILFELTQLEYQFRSSVLPSEDFMT